MMTERRWKDLRASGSLALPLSLLLAGCSEESPPDGSRALQVAESPEPPSEDPQGDQPQSEQLVVPGAASDEIDYESWPDPEPPRISMSWIDAIDDSLAVVDSDGLRLRFANESGATQTVRLRVRADDGGQNRVIHQTTAVALPADAFSIVDFDLATSQLDLGAMRYAGRITVTAEIEDAEGTRQDLLGPTIYFRPDGADTAHVKICQDGDFASLMRSGDYDQRKDASTLDKPGVVTDRVVHAGNGVVTPK